MNRTQVKKPVNKAAPGGCEEASPLSRDQYIPCNRPARWKMQHVKEGVLRMCDFCADHNKRRGFENIGPYPNKKEQPKDTTAQWVSKNKGNPERASKASGEKIVSKTAVTDTSELEQDLSSVETTGPLQDLKKAVSNAVSKMKELEQLEEAAKALRSEIHHINSRVIPEIMASTGFNKYRTDKGEVVEIKDFVSGSLPKDPDRRQAALDWLTENKGGDLIKHAISMAFGRDEQKEARKVAATLKKLGVEFKDEMSVHAGTLGAFARERMKKGEEVPLDLLGLFAGRMANITLPGRAEPDDPNR